MAGVVWASSRTGKDPDVASTPSASRIPAWSRTLTALLWMALAYLIGYWLSQWLAPQPLAAPPASLAQAISTANTSSTQAADSLALMFAVPAAGQPAPVETTEVKLSGVMMAGAQSMVIASVNGEKPRVFELGEPLSASLRLHEVRANAAVLRRANGSLVVVELPEREVLLR